MAGPWLLEKMRYPCHYLLQTSHIIQGIGTFKPNIMAAILARITINNVVARAIVYICEDEDGHCLSEKVMKDAGILDDKFPHNKLTSRTKAATTQCHCPTRTLPPPLPQKIPFPAMQENRDRMEYYTASAFNTCEHQELQKMAGPPLKVTFHHDVELVAVRVPDTVPVKVKASL